MLEISGQLLDADGNGIPNTRVQAAGDDSGAGAQTAADGTFTITVPSAGSYRLSMNIDGCTAYYRPDGATGSRNEATQVQVSDSDVEELQIPAVMEGMLDYDQRSAVGRRGQWHSQYVGKRRR